MASRNGLNPKIRGPKGVGYGRALPAPFSFRNGIIPPGTSGSNLLITPLIGKTWPLEGCIELWANIIDQKAQREFEVSFNDGTKLRVTAYFSAEPFLEITGRGQTGAAAPNGTYVNGTKYHFAFMWDATNSYAWGNALIPNTMLSGSSSVSPINSNVNLPITGAALCGQIDGSDCSTTKMDEVRIYNRKLSINELVLNDNGGNGNNPSTTENLFAWYQFEKFETLDFSLLQDDSDLRLGIRDFSGQNNHAQVFDMDTDPTSPTYVLKPF
ncbi:MAG: hypothetical protein ACHQHN_18025 [Sphingobacteriales bacterium]